MFSLSRRAKITIFVLGLLVCAVGMFSASYVDQFDGYKKIVLLLPIFVGLAMCHIDTYANLKDESSKENALARGKALGLLFVILAFGLYCLVAWLRDITG